MFPNPQESASTATTIATNALEKESLNWSSWNPSSISRSRNTAASDGPAWGTGRLFESSQERDIAISMHRKASGPGDILFPDIFKYGICYKPGPSAGNVYRTITISGLPLAVTMNALLKKVQGGAVVSAMLLDTFTITGSQTALITFLYEHDAVLFEDYAIQHPEKFRSHGVKVVLLTTPTWPMSVPLHRAIFEHGHTRCLQVHNFPHHISPEILRRDLRGCAAIVSDRIETVKMGDNGVLELGFESIAAAGKAYGILTKYREYGQCKVTFSPDPCAQLLESFDTPIPALLSSVIPDNDGEPSLVDEHLDCISTAETEDLSTEVHTVAAG